MEIENIEIAGGCQVSTNSPGGSVVTGNLQVQLTPSSFTGVPVSGELLWSSTQSLDVYGSFYNGNVTLSDSQILSFYNSDTGFTIPNLSNNTTKYWIYLPSVSDKTLFSSISEYTIEIWVNISFIQRKASTNILSKRDGTSTFRWPYEISSINFQNKIFISCYDGNNNPRVELHNIPTNLWMQIVGVYNFTNNPTDETPAVSLSGYYNGSLIENVSLSSVVGKNIQNNHDVGICGWYRQPIDIIPEYFGGQIGIFRTYDRALNGTEIMQNFNADRARFGI